MHNAYPVTKLWVKCVIQHLNDQICLWLIPHLRLVCPKDFSKMSALSQLMCYVFMFMLVTSNLDSSQANRWPPKHKLALKSRSCKKHLKGPHGYSKKEWDRCVIEFYSHYHEVDEVWKSWYNTTFDNQYEWPLE